MINEKCAREYCSEPIENIEGYSEAIADKTQTWCCHHRLEVQGQFTNSVSLLKKCGMYFSRPANELIFVTKSQHEQIHYVLHHRLCYSMGKKYGSINGKKNAAKLTYEQRSKAGKAGGAIGGKKSKDMKFWNNGTRCIRAEECPGPEWKPGRLYFKRCSNIGNHWWNNGTVAKLSKQCPGPEWKRGRL